MRGIAAGVLAAVITSVIEVWLLAVFGRWTEQPLVPLILLVAPVLEESFKRLGVRLFTAGWGLTGLAFGVLEGMGKLRGLEEGAVLGLVISIAFHWGLGRHAEAGEWRLRQAILCHAAYNGLAMGLGLVVGDAAEWMMALVAGMILWTSFPRNH